MLNQDQRDEITYQTGTRSRVSDGTADDDANDVNTNRTAKDQVSSIDYNTDYNQEKDDADCAGARVLIKLYVLSDKLIDLRTVNLVIDEQI